MTGAEQETKQERKKFRFGRDTIIFVVGLGGIVNETFFTLSERPTLLILFAAMIGLPAFLHLDERKK